jgi:hypothetical protein
MNNEPFVSYSSNLELAEYKGEIPNNDYLTVDNLREETETWTEKTPVYDTVTKKVTEKKRLLIIEPVELKDASGEVCLDENGSVIMTETYEWVEEPIEIEVDSYEVVDEIEEEKSRTYLTCDLVANFNPAPTQEQLAKQQAKIAIKNLKMQLEATDYQAIKYAEGWLTEEEYAPIKEQRQAWRTSINELENLLQSR